MDLELVSHPLCPYVHRSTIMLREKNVPHRIRYVDDLTNKPAWFVELSPRGKVPLLVADGTVLFESAVINEFIDETHSPAWLPADPIARAKQRAWVEIANDLFAANYKYAYSTNAEDSNDGKAKVEALAARVEAELTGPYIAGASIGLPDVAAAPALYRLALLTKATGEDLFAKTPKARAWAARLASRPSVAAGVLPDFEERYLRGLREKGSFVLRGQTEAARTASSSVIARS